jgi:two-component system response regulator AtoC
MGQRTTTDRKPTILVIEDDVGTRASLYEYLTRAEYLVRSAVTAKESLGALQDEVDVVLLDLVLPDMDGFELLQRHRERQGRAAVVVLSGLAETENVVRAMKCGAVDYLPKPFVPSEQDLVLRRTLDSCATEVADASFPAPATPPASDDVAAHTRSTAMEAVWSLAKRVAPADVPVLILGESGVGKDLVARRIHAASDRAERPFVKINCAALPGELLESELFGHEKGAFTGAYAAKPGTFELADQGTIFLDEIGEMDRTRALCRGRL